VDHGGFVEFAGKSHEELPEEKYGEGAGGEERGDRQRDEGIDRVGFAPDQEERDHGDLGGEHHGGEQQDEERAAPGKTETGEAVRDEGAAQKLAGHVEDGDRVGVEQEPVEGEGEGIPGGGKVAPLQGDVGFETGDG